MKFFTVPCHESLRPFIRNYWQLESYCTAKGIQQVFSNGAASLHFYLSQAVSIDGSEELYRTSLNRHDMASMRIMVEEGHFDVFGVEFVPFCAGIFFRTPFERVHLTPADMADDEFDELSRKIHAVGSNEERTGLLDAFFLKRLSEMPADDVNMERMSDVFDEIVPLDGSVHTPPKCHEEFSPADLASTARLGQKQFTRVFNKYVGMNPKAYLRLLRFNKALAELLKHGSERSLTDTAWACGYYDLPHMIADFRAICGYSPSELLSENVKLTETFNPEFCPMKKKIKIENLI